MQNQQAEWIEEVEDLASHCSARILKAVTGYSSKATADQILEYLESDSRGTIPTFHAIAKVLGKRVRRIAYTPNQQDTPHIRFSDRMPTVEEWIMNHRHTSSIILADAHLALVIHGKIMNKCHRGRVRMDSRVSHSIQLAP